MLGRFLLGKATSFEEMKKCAPSFSLALLGLALALVQARVMPVPRKLRLKLGKAEVQA